MVQFYTNYCMPDIQVTKLHSFSGHSSGIFDLTPIDDRRFLSAGGDGQIVRWDVETGEDGKVIAKVDSTVYGILADDGRALIGENNRGIHLIDLESSKPVRSVQVKSPVFSMIRMDDSYLIGTGAGELLIFDLELNFSRKIKISNKSLRCIDFNETDLALGCSDSIIRILDRNTLDIRYELTGHTLSVFALQYHPITKNLVSTGRDAHIRSWSTFDHYQAVQDVAAHMYASNHLVFHPSLNYFASGSMDKTIKIWDGSNFALLKVIDKARHEGHGNSVNKLLWMTFNNLLVTCSDDRNVAIWDIKFN